MSLISIKRTYSEDPDFVSLAAELTEFLAVLNGEQNSFYVQHNRVDAIPTVVVAYLEEKPIGCGAFRPKDERTVEIKRMFVDTSLRGHGIGQSILSELETWAAELSFTTAILETSKRLTPAVHLYLKSGYAVIPNFGPYIGVDDSVCMQKAIHPILVS